MAIPAGLVALVAAAACRRDAPALPILDAHVHLASADDVAPLLEAMDRHGVRRAVVISTPHMTAGRPGRGLDGYLEGNEVVLAAAAAHRDRLLPFVTVDLADDRGYLDDLFRRGACGVKIYQGHHSFRDQPLDHPSHAPVWRWLAARGAPVLLHVNTARYADEIERVLAAHRLRAVCAHLCGSRTNLDRFERVASAFPDLLFDTSHGSAAPSAEGFASLERERARLRRLVERWPRRFVYGSDLVTARRGTKWQAHWDRQIRANLGLLRDARFTAPRRPPEGGALRDGEYRGLALPPRLLGPLLRDNARAWLAPCLGGHGAAAAPARP